MSEANETVVQDNTSDAPEVTVEASEEQTNVDNKGTDESPLEGQSEAPTDIEQKFLDSFNLEDLLKADFSEDAIMSNTHKDLPDYQEILKHLPENGRKLIANLRAMTTRKTQEVSEIRKDLLRQQQALALEKKALYSGKFADNVKQLAAEPEVPHDVFSDDGMNNKIKQEAAKLFQQMIEPMQEELYVTQRQSQMDRFKTDHPDLLDYKTEIAGLLRERPELKLEDAYYITKAKTDRTRLVTLENESARKKEEKQIAWTKVRPGSNVRATKVPKFRSAWDAYQWHKANGTK